MIYKISCISFSKIVFSLALVGVMLVNVGSIPAREIDTGMLFAVLSLADEIWQVGVSHYP